MLLATPPIESRDPEPTISWDDAPCPACANRHATTFFEAQDHLGGADGLWFALVQCDSCGTCYTNPRPDPASIGQFYPDSYSPHHKLVRPRGPRRWNPFRFLKPPRVEKRPVPWHGQGRLLDFGCGSGAYLAEMKWHGWQVTGLDVSAKMVERVREELGLTAYAGSLPHLELEPESFDVITMWHALEHVHEPLPVLREARRLLAPGGKIVISVPNIDSLSYRWLGKHWFGLELPRHLTHFTPMSLPLILQRAGFATEPVQYVRHADWLRTGAKRACEQEQNPPRWLRALRWRPIAAAVTWHAWWTQQSDCILCIGHK